MINKFKYLQRLISDILIYIILMYPIIKDKISIKTDFNEVETFYVVSDPTIFQNYATSIYKNEKKQLFVNDRDVENKNIIKGGGVELKYFGTFILPRDVKN